MSNERIQKSTRRPKPTRLGKIYQVYDADTGEVILDKETVQRSSNGKDWCIVYQSTLYRLACDKTIRLSDVRVLFYLLANLDYQGSFQTSKTDIGNKIGMSHSQVLSSLKALKKLDLIREGKKNGTAIFFVNPYEITRGKDRDKLLRTYEQQPNEYLDDDGYPTDDDEPKQVIDLDADTPF